MILSIFISSLFSSIKLLFVTKDDLNLRLNTGRISKDERDELAGEVLKNPQLTGPLLKLVFEEDKTGLWHCSWVFDTVMRKNLSLLLPHLDTFVNGLEFLKSESVIRPMSHTCELLILRFFEKKDSLFTEHLKPNYLEKITEVCFDWLIGPHKVASKAFAMTCLFYLGEQFDWVRPELKSVLEQQISKGTAGFKSRGSKTLDLLSKLGH